MYMYVPYYPVMLFPSLELNLSKLASTFRLFAASKVFGLLGFIHYSESGSLTKQPLQ